MTTIKSGTIKRMHINQALIRSNMKAGTDEPVCLVQTSKGSHLGKTIHILDKDGIVVATLKQSLQKPLGCGARVWLETLNAVVVD